ncbi:multidrug effflux MFS transporter [Pedomonas mirosovicensis]|uniref:multidrug effflux MFS transporter n=1 Tax=Pedomonas mirosovicensis TaxID=2908641 RepID=UPI0021675F57|nr:multidrug effflux MFS transporter [Pedomonas mirosovicensis]MCH8684220.1 multidrug effflux MFS transporter [Pedomonas mirosovicensis]
MSETSPPSATTRPGASGLPLTLIILLGVLTAFSPMAIDMYLPSLPAMSRDMGAPTSTGQLTLASFFIGLALGQLIYGPLSDRLGRRPPLMAGVLLYTLASVGCAFTTSMEALIGLRFVQALGAAAAPLIARAVVADRCSGVEAARTFSMLMLIMGLAPILAPTLGGFVLLAGGWRAIFWVLAGFGALALVWSLAGLPESLPAEVRNSRPHEPTLSAYKQVIANPAVIAYALLAALGSAALFSYISNAAALIIETYGVSPAHFGWVFGLNAAALIVSTQINRVLLARHGPLTLIRRANVAMSLLGIAMTASAATGWGGMWGVLVPMFFVMSTLGFTAPNATALAMGADRSRAGTVSSVVGCLQFTVGALFAAVTGAAYNGTAVPMALGILVAALCSAVLLRRVVPRLRAAAH